MSEYFPYLIVAGFATMLTRFLPYWIFKRKSENRTLAHLQRHSGLIIMAILTIYGLKSIGFNLNLNGTIMAFCLALTFILHKIWHNFLLSITIPTILYMILLRIL